MVRQEQLAVRVSASYQAFAQLGFLEVFADVKPSEDPEKVAQRLDEIVAQFIEEGPTEDEIQRVVVRNISGTIAGLESVGGFSGKAPTLAEGLLYAGDPEFYKKQLASASVAEVKAAMQRWLKRPVYALHVVPGEREAYEEAKGVASRTGMVSRGPAHYVPPGAEPVGRGPLFAADRSQLPAVGTVANLDFPTVETGELSNGIKVHFARRDAVPTLRLAVSFDAGYAADPKEKLGTQSLLLTLLPEGTTTRSSTQIAEEQERLGATVRAAANLDTTSVSLFALVPNLARSLDLLADVVKNPAVDPAELDRLRVQQLNGIEEERADPLGLAQRTLPGLIYGQAHPYGIPFSGTGDPAVVGKLSREDLLAFHQAWIRPDNATIFAVGDTTLAELLPLLEQRFGKDWAAPAVARGAKDFAAEIPAGSERIVLVNRPGSPQSMIYAGQVMSLQGSDDLEALLAGNEVFGGNFLSRINMDLRETKGWSYGVRGGLTRVSQRMPYVLRAPVQADRTGDAIAALKKHLVEFTSSKGVTPEELARTINGRIRELPGSFETSASVLAQMQQDVLYQRPANYVETLAERYRGFDAAALDGAVRGAIRPGAFTWVVVGDKTRVLSQLQRLKVPVTVIEAADVG
jgi:predicted Zn-dependent peptidase